MKAIKLILLTLLSTVLLGNATQLPNNSYGLFDTPIIKYDSHFFDGDDKITAIIEIKSDGGVPVTKYRLDFKSVDSEHYCKIEEKPIKYTGNGFLVQINSVNYRGPGTYSIKAVNAVGESNRANFDHK